MSIKSVIVNFISMHPKLVMTITGVAVAVAVSAVMGLISPEQVFAPGGKCGRCYLQ